jgi:hypothetical protein
MSNILRINNRLFQRTAPSPRRSLVVGPQSALASSSAAISIKSAVRERLLVVTTAGPCVASTGSAGSGDSPDGQPKRGGGWRTDRPSSVAMVLRRCRGTHRVSNGPEFVAEAAQKSIATVGWSSRAAGDGASEFLSKFKAKLFHRRQRSKNSFLPLVPRYLHRNAILRLVIANLHGDALRTAIRSSNHMIVHICIRSMATRGPIHCQAGLSGRTSVTKNFGPSGRTKDRRLRGRQNSYSYSAHARARWRLKWRRRALPVRRRSNSGGEPNAGHYNTSHKLPIRL